MRSILRSAILAGSVLSLSFVLVGCEDAKTTTPTTDGKGVTTEPTNKDAMEPAKGGMEPAKGGMEPAKGGMEPAKGGMEPAAPKGDTPATPPAEPPK